jgi:arylsulfatase A-like enzyme
MRGLPKLVMLAFACLLVSCGAEQQRLNVILIGVDTLRRDHLGCYGYQRETSPNIDRLARRSVLFEDAVSASPWTLPSFATALTSLYPTQHGAGSLETHSGGAYGTRMSTSFPPLAMMLLKQGYSTGAVINAPALAPELGVERGFESYLAVPRWKRRRADETTRDVLKWIDENREGPFFMFAHYFDPHLDYEPPPPYDQAFDTGYTGSIGSVFTRETYGKMEDVLTRKDDPQAEREWDRVRALYDGEILFTDKAVGDLIDGLEERGLTGNTLIVLMGDHGEEFFDHGGFEHGHTLYDELIKVPLMFSLPGRLPEGKRIADQVRILDLLPTVLDVLGIRAWTHLEGVSLMPLMTGEGKLEQGGGHLLPPEFAYTECMLYGTEKKSITAYPWKLVYDTVTEDEQIFNLAGDPGEQTNMVANDAAPRRMLEEVLFKTMMGVSETWYVEIAGGRDSHTFDIAVGTQGKPINGNITNCRFMDAEGHFIDNDRLPITEAASDLVRLEGLEVEGIMTMAFKATPRMVPVKFDFRIDGRSAIGATYLGERLSAPERMPFEQKGGRAMISEGAPRQRPKPPYIIVWQSSPNFEPGEQVELGEDTKRELKALGYIQ